MRSSRSSQPFRVAGASRATPTDTLGASPLHAVHHLLGPWRELVEGDGRPGIPDHHRIALDVLQDDGPTHIVILTEVSDLIATALIEDVQAARGLSTITVGVLGQVIDEHFELLALESSYGDRLWFGGFQVGVALQPPDQVLGGIYHIRRAGFEHFLDVHDA